MVYKGWVELEKVNMEGTADKINLATGNCKKHLGN